MRIVFSFAFPNIPGVDRRSPPDPDADVVPSVAAVTDIVVIPRPESVVSDPVQVEIRFLSFNRKQK